MSSHLPPSSIGSGFGAFRQQLRLRPEGRRSRRKVNARNFLFFLVDAVFQAFVLCQACRFFDRTLSAARNQPPRGGTSNDATHGGTARDSTVGNTTGRRKETRLGALSCRNNIPRASRRPLVADWCDYRGSDATTWKYSGGGSWQRRNTN